MLYLPGWTHRCLFLLIIDHTIRIQHKSLFSFLTQIHLQHSISSNFEIAFISGLSLVTGTIATASLTNLPRKLYHATCTTDYLRPSLCRARLSFFRFVFSRVCWPGQFCLGSNTKVSCFTYGVALVSRLHKVIGLFCPIKGDDILEKRHIIPRSLLTIATQHLAHTFAGVYYGAEHVFQQTNM